jgi:RNA polymerase sigma factor (sigma-70 family)
MTPTAEPQAAPKLSDDDRTMLIAGVDKLIKRTVRGSLVPRREWDDVCQDIRLELWKASARFDPARAKFTTFSVTVARNFIRRRCHQFHDANPAGVVPHPLDPNGDGEDGWHRVPGSEPDPLDAIIAAEEEATGDDLGAGVGDLLRAIRAQAFEERLSLLGPGKRRLVEMVVLDGLSPQQIADRLGHPLKVVRTNLLLAVRQLNGERPPNGERSPPEARRSGLDRHREAIRAAIEADPKASNREIIDRLSLGCATGTLSDYLRVSGLAAIRASRHERSTATRRKREPACTA